jgi:hypothetical protein
MILPVDFWDEVKERFESRMAKLREDAGRAQRVGLIWSQLPVEHLREADQNLQVELKCARGGFHLCVKCLPEPQRLVAELAFRTALYDLVSGHWEYSRRLLEEVRSDRRSQGN